MSSSDQPRETRRLRADSAHGHAPNLRVAGNGATSRFTKLDAGGGAPKSRLLAANGLLRKRLSAGRTKMQGVIDLLSARRLLYKSPEKRR